LPGAESSAAFLEGFLEAVGGLHGCGWVLSLTEWKVS
jgi:hypothetical protein